MCAYKPPRITNSFKRGMATILTKKSDPAHIKVRLQVPGEKKGEYDIEEYVLDRENCPAYVRSGEWQVSLSSNGDKMWSAYPANGQFVVQFLDIAHKEGELPAPTAKKDAYGHDYQQFIINVKIVEGDYKDVTIPLFCRYNFGPVGDGKGNNVVAFTHYDEKRPSAASKFLDKVTTALGLWDEEVFTKSNGALRWEDNLLPTMAKRFRKQVEEFDRKALLTMSDGYATNMKQHTTDAWDDDEDDVKKDPAPASKPDEPKVKAPVSEPDPDDNPAISDDDDEIGSGGMATSAKPKTVDDEIAWD